MQTKERILEAATNVVARDGSNKLTLEAVAAEAGVSKGGLLYHFPSKRALLEGMLEVMLQRMACACWTICRCCPTRRGRQNIITGFWPN
jgi:AcrR family transcriptional regulator